MDIVNFIVGRKTKYLVLLFWLIVIVLAGPLAGKLSGAEKNEAKSWLPGGAESTRVLDLQKAFQSPNEISAIVVYQRPGGLTAADRAKVASDASRFPSVARIDGRVSGPSFSADGQAAVVTVPFDLGQNGWSRANTVVTKMKSIAGTEPGLSVHITGPAGYASDSASAFKGIDSTLLFSALAVVIVILLLTYRSPILWLLPVISAGVALWTSQGVIYLLAKHAGLTVNAQSAGILTVLVFGASTDYALLLVARYREELRRHQDRHEAMALALRRAGPAIIASASTVTAGLLCLLLAETNSTKGLGPVCAIGIVVGLLAMITLLPALLVTVGRWVFWPVRPRFGSAEPTTTGFWARVGQRIARNSRQVWVVTVLALVVASLGLIGLHATGLTNKQSFRGHPDSVVGEQVLARHFPAGSGDPVIVITNAGAAPQVQRVLASTPGIASVSPPIIGQGKAYLQGTLTAAPDSQAAYHVIDHLRASVHAVPGAGALVGGNSAINLDVGRAANHDRNLIIPIVLLVVFIILALLLRAIVAPLILIATVVLSFTATLGISAVFFSHVFHFGGADTSLPLFVFIFLVALGIDYNIFLMSRVREETLDRGTRRGTLAALAATGGVITSAGFVLAGTFAVLATLPLTAFSEIGFAVALGVLLDTIVIRSILVTAINFDVGDRIWWPSRLMYRGREAVEAVAATESQPA
jgi:putative drug exporter of the RND superfamily